MGAGLQEKGESGKDRTGEHVALESARESGETLNNPGPVGKLSIVVSTLIEEKKLKKADQEAALAVLVELHGLCLQFGSETIDQDEYLRRADELEEVNHWLGMDYSGTGTPLSKTVFDLAQTGDFVQGEFRGTGWTGRRQRD